MAQWITRLTTDQKIPGSNPGELEFFCAMIMYIFTRHTESVPLHYQNHIFTSTMLYSYNSLESTTLHNTHVTRLIHSHMKSQSFNETKLFSRELKHSWV